MRFILVAIFLKSIWAAPVLLDSVEDLPFLRSADELSMPSCEKACVSEYMAVLGSFVIEGEVTKSMDELCSRYEAAESCMRPLTQCYGGLLPTLTSGAQYMCVEQRKAFDVLIGCIGRSGPAVKKDCDLQCHTESFVAGIAVKDTVMATLDQPVVSDTVNVRNIIEPHLGKLFFSEGCRISKCLMECYKTKFNMLCEGTGGSILMEALSRPLNHISSDSLASTTKFLTGFMGGLLPSQCAGLSHEGMRINKDLDEEIKRMYENRKRLTPEDSKYFGIPTTDENPFEIATSMFDRDATIRDRLISERRAQTVAPSMIKEDSPEIESSGNGSDLEANGEPAKFQNVPLSNLTTFGSGEEDLPDNEGSGSGLEYDNCNFISVS